jgi:ankyrin repeat protein
MNLEQFEHFGNGLSQSIYIAALTNDTKYILQYHNDGFPLDIEDDRSQTLLHLAARNKAHKSMELLLMLGLDPNRGDKYLETPMHISTFMGDNEMVELLLTYQADVNCKNKNLQTPLHNASLKGDIRIVKMLLEHDADIYSLDEHLSSVMHYAVRSKKLKMVKFLVEKGAIINSLDMQNLSIMHYVAMYSTIEIAKYLLELNVNPYMKDHYKQTPLHKAVEHHNWEMIEVFSYCGLTSYDQSRFNKSPYDLAVIHGKHETIERFNQLKNDREYQNDLRSNALTFSLIMNQFDLAEALIKRTDVNKKDYFGNSPLFYAIINEEPYLVELLLEYDANIDNIDNCQLDALYYAAITKQYRVCEMIIQKGYNPTKKYFGLTLLEFAKINRLDDIKELFLTYSTVE